LQIYFLPLATGKRLKGCTARIVPNYSGFRKRNPPERDKRGLRPFEVARLLVRLDHVARFIVNADQSIM